MKIKKETSMKRFIKHLKPVENVPSDLLLTTQHDNYASQITIFDYSCKKPTIFHGYQKDKK